MNMFIRLALAGATAMLLSGCLGMGASAPGDRVVKYAYCTDMQGNVVQDPAAAVERGQALRCYNFISK